MAHLRSDRRCSYSSPAAVHHKGSHVQITNKGPSDSIADSFDEFKPTDEAFAPEEGNGKNIPSYRKPSSRPSGLGIGSNGNIFQNTDLHLGRLLL